MQLPDRRPCFFPIVNAGGGPAVLFNNIKGYRKKRGSRFFTCSLSSFQRLAMGLESDTSYKDLVAHYVKGTGRPIAPRIVTKGACKDVMLTGKNVDLLQFPSPFLHPLDGGRYMGTFHLVVTKDPETGLQNVGMYRMMLHDRNHPGTLFLSRQDWEIHYRKYTALGQKMPIAVCFGPPQVTLIAAFAKVNHPPDEFSYAGGLIGEPIDLIQYETVDLQVPAESEIDAVSM